MRAAMVELVAKHYPNFKEQKGPAGRFKKAVLIALEPAPKGILTETAPKEGEEEERELTIVEYAAKFVTAAHTPQAATVFQRPPIKGKYRPPTPPPSPPKTPPESENGSEAAAADD